MTSVESVQPHHCLPDLITSILLFTKMNIHTTVLQWDGRKIYDSKSLQSRPNIETDKHMDHEYRSVLSDFRALLENGHMYKIFLVKSKDLGKDIITMIPGPVFKALRELFQDYTGCDAFKDKSVKKYVVESFSNDDREWLALCALTRLTSRGSGELFAFIFLGAHEEKILNSLRSEGVEWNIVGQRIMVRVAYSGCRDNGTESL